MGNTLWVETPHRSKYRDWAGDFVIPFLSVARQRRANMHVLLDLIGFESVPSSADDDGPIAVRTGVTRTLEKKDNR